MRTKQFADPWESGLLDPLPPIDDALNKAGALVRLLLRTELAVVENEAPHNRIGGTR